MKVVTAPGAAVSVTCKPQPVGPTCECTGCQRRQELGPDLTNGAGCSVAAINEGIPVDTSMGFTLLEGSVMATRCGDIDAGYGKEG